MAGKFMNTCGGVPEFDTDYARNMWTHAGLPKSILIREASSYANIHGRIL